MPNPGCHDLLCLQCSTRLMHACSWPLLLSHCSSRSPPCQVWQESFFAGVHEFVTNELQPWTLGRKLNAAIYFPSDRTIHLAVKEHGCARTIPALKAFMAGKSATTKRSWIDLFRMLQVKDSSFLATDSEAKHWDFDDLLNEIAAFLVLTPMLNRTLEKNLLFRLQRSGALMSPVAFDRAGVLYSCSCGEYMHYAWCIHACGKAIIDGVFKVPRRFEFAHLAGRLKRGRPHDAVKGGALGKK
jgi:hypothetical protein